MADSVNNQSNGNGYYANIDDYYDKIHRTTWARRSAGVMAGATMGTMYGTIIGIVAAYLPLLLSNWGVAGIAATIAAPSLTAIGTSIAVFAAAASFLGIVFSSEVASHAASTAAGLEEKEKREKIERQKDGILTGHQAQHASDSDKGPPLFSWKVALVTIPLFAAFGALIAFHPETSAWVLEKAVFPTLIQGQKLIQSATPAAIATSSIIFGMFGGAFAMKNSWISNKLNNFYYKVLSETLFKSPEKETAIASERMADANPSLEMEQPKSKSPPVNRVHFIQAIIERGEKPRPEQSTILVR